MAIFIHKGSGDLFCFFYGNQYFKATFTPIFRKFLIILTINTFSCMSF